MYRNVIYHNPRCSKSRATVKLLQENNISIDVVEYIIDPPSIEILKFIGEELNLPVIELIRHTDKRFAELGLNVEDDRTQEEWLSVLHQNPELMIRPIVIFNKRVIIARPPEKVLTII